MLPPDEADDQNLAKVQTRREAVRRIGAVRRRGVLE